MKTKLAENKSDGTRIPENQKKCYHCKANGHNAKNCPDKKNNKMGDAFFIRMCNIEEDDKDKEMKTKKK